MKKGKITSSLIALAITAVIGFVIYYVALPPMNFHSVGFYFYWMFLGILFAVLHLLVPTGYRKKRVPLSEKGMLIGFGFSALFLLIMVCGGIYSAKLFHAKGYASVITTQTAVFEDDMPKITNVTNIALMDTESARIIGNRTLGSLSELVSQYYVSENYTQINYQNSPKKVANLEYDDFFKWMNNRGNGVPGYVIVDPVNNTASYQKLENPLKYVTSGYFGDNLERKLRFSYPTKIFGSYYFEIDEEGKPFYIVSCMSPKIGLFGAMDVSEVILFNPCDGSSELYAVEDVPAWVDIVYDGELAMEKYNWQGTLSGGFINSVIGNKNCKMATDDYGYIVIGDDVWYFTGVTSVTADESNVGFIITNARTGEYKFYPVVGAEEYSAMSAAEGEVQEKGYTASFPSLINVDGYATYIMVLKDTGGLVKLYALVNVENYGVVATGESQTEAFAAYKKLLRSNQMQVENPDGITKEIKVSEVRLITVDNLPTIYITSTDGDVFKGYLNTDESLILIRKEDTLKIICETSEIERLYFIDSWEYNR